MPVFPFSEILDGDRQLTVKVFDENGKELFKTTNPGVVRLAAGEQTIGKAIITDGENDINIDNGSLNAILRDELGEAKFTDDNPGSTEIIDGKVTDADEVDPDDGDDLPEVTSGLLIGTEGDVNVTLVGMDDETSIVLPNLAAGVHHAYRVKRVWETDTTAENIIALY